MSLNQSFISDFSEYYRWSQRTKIKYKLHYGWCTGRRFTAATLHNTSCRVVSRFRVKKKTEKKQWKKQTKKNSCFSVGGSGHVSQNCDENTSVMAPNICKRNDIYISNLSHYGSNCYCIILIWAAWWQNQRNGICVQRRLRSAWASGQSDQSLRCPHEGNLGH